MFVLFPVSSETEVYSFADDVAITFTNVDPDLASLKVQNHLALEKDWSREHGMEKIEQLVTFSRRYGKCGMLEVNRKKKR